MKKLYFLSLLFCAKAFAQTDNDALMMQKNFFCVGLTYNSNSWTNYYEGTLKRDNQNFGRVSTTSIMPMGNYGITDKLNVIIGLPYVVTKASAGQYAGQRGLQDAAVNIKYLALEKEFKNNLSLKVFGIASASAPVGNYTPDLLPLSIGLKAKTAGFRAMVDAQKGNLTLTGSAMYTYRGNVTLPRNTYYTTQMHYSNKVAMPNMLNYNVRAGFRSDVWIIEGILNHNNILGGFDITRNNMPFVSNEMDATQVGLHVKYETTFLDGLSFLVDGFTTLKARNMGKASGCSFGAFYIMDFSKKVKTTNNAKN
jgi:hypothetical protein